MLLEEYNWKTEVLQSPEPVLVDFWAEWCPPCRAMEPSIRVLAQDHKVCKVNIDKNQKLAATYSIEVVPTLLIFKAGRIANRFQGLTPEHVLRNALDSLR
jgi:thioredoxin 1